MQPYGPFRHLHESDFPKVNADNRYAKIDQITDANFARYSKVVRAERISTVAEYHAALVERADNRAGKNIDHGNACGPTFRWVRSSTCCFLSTKI
jgi:hypothetical protein